MGIKGEYMEKNKEQIMTVASVIVMISVMLIFKLLNFPLLITNIFFVASSFVFMNYWWKREAESKWELWIIWGAFVARVIICVLDIYAIDYIDIPFTGGDSVGYLAVAEEYYSGKMDRFYTYYPYVINAIFQVTGLNRFAAQFVNILCWCISAVIMQKSCSLLELKKEYRILTILFYSFMPVNMIYNSSLMREALPALAMMYLFYGILKWMKDGKYVSLIVAVVVSAPGFVLHNSMVVIWAVLALVLVLYSPEKQCFCIEKKSVFAFSIGVAGVVGIVFALANDMIAVQIPDFSNGIFNAINERLESFYRNYGGSTYLLNEYVYDYPSLFTGTIKRMIYFFFAPFPFFWRGFGDAFAFFASASIYIISVIFTISSLFFKKKDSYRFVMGTAVILVCGIFAWMVSNSGTAMRHREKFLGIVVLLGMYSFKIVREGWKCKREKTNDKIN